MYPSILLCIALFLILPFLFSFLMSIVGVSKAIAETELFRESRPDRAMFTVQVLYTQKKCTIPAMLLIHLRLVYEFQWKGERKN